MMNHKEKENWKRIYGSMPIVQIIDSTISPQMRKMKENERNPYKRGESDYSRKHSNNGLQNEEKNYNMMWFVWRE